MRIICSITVFSWRRNDMAESSLLWSGAGSAFHIDGPATAKLTDSPLVGGTMSSS